MQRATVRRGGARATRRLLAAVLLLSVSLLHAHEEPTPGADVRFASAPHNAGAAAVRALPECALLVFRHTQKTGGSTLRNFFRHQEATGDWEFYSPQGDHNWPEVSNRKRLELLLSFWEALESPATNFTRSPKRLIMEWHAEAHLLPPWERAVEVVSWLRRAARQRGCPVMLMTLVRQPVDLYASWYKYEGLRIAKGQALLDWVAENPNLQAATLMAGVSRPASLPFITRLHEGRSDRLSVWDPRDAAVLRVMLSRFDLIAPMERFDEALALVCEAMGFSAAGYVRLNEGVKRDMWSMYSSSLSAVDLHRMSEYGRSWQPRADDELVHAVERAAFVDLRMYAQASHVFDKKVRSAGAAFESRLKALQETPAADGWRGERPRPRYKWFAGDEAQPKAIRVLQRATGFNASTCVWSFVPTQVTARVR